MASKSQILKSTNNVWCAECKRLFDAFAEADQVHEKLISDVQTACATADAVEANRIQVLVPPAMETCHHARERFLQHRKAHKSGS